MRFVRVLSLVVALGFVVGGTGSAEAKKKISTQRPVAAKKIKLPPKKAAAPVLPQRKGASIPAGRVSGGVKVTVKLRPGGLYLAPCLLGTQEGILPLWEPQPIRKAVYKPTCISSIDRSTRLIFTITCAGSLVENESAAYPLDREFTLRFSCPAK